MARDEDLADATTAPDSGAWFRRLPRDDSGDRAVTEFTPEELLAMTERALERLCDCTMQSMMIVCIMTALTIRDVSEDAVRTMKIRAAQAGQSLQAYLRSLIEREAARPTVTEAVEQARRQATADISTTDILAAIDEGRTGR